MASYSPHHRDDAQGHIFLGPQKTGAVTINLRGAASMTQEELNFYGEIMATAITNMTPEQRQQAKDLERKFRG